MHNPMHPGDFIKQAYVDDLGLSIRKIAKGLNVAPSTLARLVKGESNVTPEMAMRLSKALHGSPELWLNMQKTLIYGNYGKWICEVSQKSRLRPLDFRGPTRVRERVMRRFKSMKQAQRFLKRCCLQLV